MNEHISSAYDRDLEGITTLIMRMGGLVEEAILKSVKSLSDRDIELAGAIQRSRSRDLKAAVRALQEDVILTLTATTGEQKAAEISELSIGASVRLPGWRNKLVVDVSRLMREFAADPDAIIHGEAAPIAKAPNQVDYRIRAMVQLVF